LLVRESRAPAGLKLDPGGVVLVSAALEPGAELQNRATEARSQSRRTERGRQKASRAGWT